MRHLWIILLLCVAACDTGARSDADVLVVEAFFDVGQPLPEIRVQRAAPFEGAYPDTAALDLPDADVTVTRDGAAIAYAPVAGRPGRYAAVDTGAVWPGVAYAVDVAWQGQQARAETYTPPRLVLENVRVVPFDAPIRAVLLDSLRFDTLGTGARQGFVYPIEVFATWPLVATSDDSLYWMRSQLKPARGFSSTVVDFFFPPERIVPEGDIAREGVQRSWRGLYVVPVETAQSPLPPHRVRVALVRSGQDYARFAATRTSPTQREPRSNVVGGRGIVAGLSVDSVVVEVNR